MLRGSMQGEGKFAGARLWVALFWLLPMLTLPARAQAASAQLNITLSVQSSITLVFNNNPSVGTPGFCPLSNAGTSNVGLDLGSAAFPGNTNVTCGNYTHLTASFYQVSSAFDVLVTKSNSSSPSYRLEAQISSAPPQGVIWLIDNITLSNTAFSPLNTASNYGQPLTKTLQVQVRNNVPAQILQETITFLATAN
ncbi:MAG TPA: hypothetical protein VF532_16090 [Candidatus Angelobacter sp.]